MMETKQLSIDELDRRAFGVVQGVQRLPLAEIQIRYQADYDDALDYVAQHPEDYEEALDTEPVQVQLERGVYWLQDGHHRYVTAQVRGDRDILVDLTIRDNPVVALTRRAQQETACSDRRAVVQTRQEDPANDSTGNQKSTSTSTTGSLRGADGRRDRRRPRGPGGDPPDERSESRDDSAGGGSGGTGPVAYRVDVDSRATRKDLKKIPHAVATVVATKMRAFVNNPRPPGVEKVKDARYLYRIHIKDKYRLIYSIFDDDLLVEIQHIRLKGKRTYDNLRDPVPPSQRHSSHRDRDAGPQELELERLFAQLLPGTKFANKVFAVGGYVRDQLQEREPADLDVAVEMPYGAQRLAGFLVEQFGDAVTDPEPLTYDYPIWFMRFVKDVEYQGDVYATVGAELDLTDTQTVDRLGDEPTTRFGPVQEDVQRRDFTVNMLYKDLTSGEILDPTGVGQSDVERGLLRVRPNESAARTFREQPRRMLRLIRFMVQYDWQPDPDVEAALVESAGALEELKRHGIEKEFGKLHRRRLLADALLLMKQYGLLAPLQRAWARADPDTTPTRATPC